MFRGLFYLLNYEWNETKAKEETPKNLASHILGFL